MIPIRKEMREWVVNATREEILSRIKALEGAMSFCPDLLKIDSPKTRELQDKHERSEDFLAICQCELETRTTNPDERR